MKTFDNKITLNLKGNAEVNVKGFIAPIQHTIGSFHKRWDALANLRAAKPEKQYSTAVFRDFLPTEAVSVGECWKIEEIGVLELLRQLHPNPNLDMHINAGDSLGLWACLRAHNDQFADITFRVHAEFKLEDGWFTPSQFTGNLTIDRIEEKVVFFKMFVPEGTVNFDVNWETQLENWDSPRWITDAGFCPRMELWTESEDVLQDTEFAAAITEKKAERALIQRLYESEQINWVLPEQALELAQARQKPLHVISIDGPLVDEAC